VKDVAGNPVPNATVTFTAPASGPSGSFAGSLNTAITNASGVATSPATTANGIFGSFAITANVTPALSPAATFALTNAGLNLSIEVTSGTPQTAMTGTAFAT